MCYYRKNLLKAHVKRHHPDAKEREAAKAEMSPASDISEVVPRTLRLPELVPTTVSSHRIAEPVECQVKELASQVAELSADDLLNYLVAPPRSPLDEDAHFRL